MPDTLAAFEAKKREKISVYLLAAPEDRDECNAIQKHLSPIVRNSKIPIEIESDFSIPAGEDTDKYKQRLYDADIVLDLISVDFINNDDIYARNKKVIARYNNNEAVLLPILVRNCLWKSTPFVNLPLLPKNFQPLNNKQFWNSEDDALTAVVSDIYDSINKFSSEIDIRQFQNITTTQPAVEQTISTSNVAEASPAAAIHPAAISDEPKPVTGNVAPAKVNKPLETDWRKDYYRNTTWKRGAAFMLDNLLTMFPVMAVAFIIASAAVVDDDLVVTDTDLGYILSATFLVYFIVCAIMESSSWRGTFGKRIMKLQITDRDGHAISFGRAFWRNVVRLIVGYSYLLVVPAIIQYFTFQKSKQLFHDQLSSTVIGEKLLKS